MRSARRICIVAPGSSIHAKRWVDSLFDRGYEVLWVTTGGSKVRSTKARQFVPTTSPEGTSAWKLGRVREYFSILAKIVRFRPDFVHLHYLRGDRFWYQLFSAQKPFVISVWGSDVAVAQPGIEGLQVDERKRQLLRKATRVTATSRFLADQTISRFGTHLSIDVIPFGVELEMFSVRSGEEETKEPVIGFLKTYTPGYGPDVLLEAISKIRLRVPRVRLAMRGFGDPDPYLQLAESLGLGGTVEIRGAVEHEAVSQVLESFDIFCMPSRQESFGVAAIEAAASGLPVVATRVGGIPEAVVDGQTGLLVPPDDPDSLAEALVYLLEDPLRARTMGAAGRQHVEEHFDWSKNVSSMEQVYDEVTRQRRLRGSAGG